MKLKELFKARPYSAFLLLFAVIDTPLMILFKSPMATILFVTLWISFLIVHLFEIYDEHHKYRG